MTPRLALISGIALLAAAQGLAWWVLTPLRPVPTRAQEVYDALTPGEFAGTLMLGGFRGTACDLLWMRADMAKEAGRFYESVALFQTISRIQPRFEQPWQYMAWDLAYNISHEVESQEAKWSWVVAGIRTAVRGFGRNPGSEKLLRHLAWMFHHKGDLFHGQIEAANWSSELNPVLAAVNAQIEPSKRIEPFPDTAGLGNFAVSSRLYRACVALAERDGRRGPPAFVRRMVPLAIESDGNVARNRGRHLDALRRYQASLEAWEEVAVWARATPRDDNEGNQRRMTLDSYERNSGALRRKAAQLARQLGGEQGEATAQRIEERDLAGSAALLARPGWRTSAAKLGVRWLDEGLR